VEEKCVRVPAGLDWAEAALLPCVGDLVWVKGMVAGKSVLLMGKC
jgi:NADPH:quinone reductase-like Zn-dependent oxidoreductase